MKVVFLAIICCLALALGRNVEVGHPWLRGLPQVHQIPHNSNEVHDFDPYTKVTFHLFTRTNPDEAVQVWVGDLNNSPFDPSKPTYFILHGYNSYFFSSGNLAMKDAFLRAQDCNVVGVDWSGPGGGPLYNVCRDNARPTGFYIGEFYQYLATQGAALTDMHCAGHSLGAHVCGYSGKAVNGTLGRISGLDPALPLFDLENPAERLANTDAEFVDIIHTCGGWYGFANSIGHADFYPNDGANCDQPGCGLIVDGSCSHGRAHEFFVESIETANFASHKCTSWADFDAGMCAENEASPMGYLVERSLRGDFYLHTAAQSPFALG